MEFTTQSFGAALRSLGYDRDCDVVVRMGANPSFALVPATGWRSVHVDRERSTIRLRPGTELELGATAKALAADRIAADVERETGSPVLVSLGGDSAVAGTARLATSSTTVRRRRAELHHIVDPRTGASAPQIWRTAGVAATAAIVPGAGAPAWLESRGLPARLERRYGAIQTLRGRPDESEVGWAA